MQRLERHQHLNRRAIGVGNDVTFLVAGNRFRIHFRNHQRQIGVQPKLEGFVIATQPALPARGANSAETLAPAEDRQISTPLKSNLAMSWTVSTSSSPKL